MKVNIQSAIKEYEMCLKIMIYSSRQATLLSQQWLLQTSMHITTIQEKSLQTSIWS